MKMWVDGHPFHMRHAVSVTCILVFMLHASAGISHDLVGILHDFKGDQTPESVKSFNRAYLETGDHATRAVLVNAFIWPVPTKLTVCFSGGMLDTHKKVATAMKEWAILTGGRLEFDFGTSTDTYKQCDGSTKHKIRIGFEKGKGNWAYIGTIGESVFPNNTVNFDIDGLNDQRIYELTLHETGHAVGFHHEHQSPAAPCSNWAWDNILRMYEWEGKTEGEKRQNMMDNMEKLSNYVLSSGQHAFTYTLYDPQSIMHYSMDPTVFTDGEKNRCCVPQAKGLSPVDKEAMKDAYARQSAKGNKTRSIEALLSKNQLSGLRDLLEKQKQLFPSQ